MFKHVCKEVAGGGLMLAWFGASYMSLMPALRSSSGAQSTSISHVSQRFVQTHLADRPEVVDALDALAKMCTLDDSGRAVGDMRRVVFRICQMAHAVRRMSERAYPSNVSMHAANLRIQAAKNKADRRLHAICVHLSCAVGPDDMQPVTSRIGRLMSGLLLEGDWWYDELKDTHAATPGTPRPASSSVRPFTATKIKAALAFDDGAANALATMAGWATLLEDKLGPRDRITEAQCLVARLVRTLVRLHNADATTRNRSRMQRRVIRGIQRSRLLFGAIIPPMELERILLELRESIGRVTS